MSAPYVNSRVSVIGTSKDDLNGQTGLATAYDSDRGRYTVKLDNGRQVSLKPQNLKPTGEQNDAGSSPADFMAGMGGEQMKRQAEAMMAKIRASVGLPPGVTEAHVALGSLAILAPMIYLFGILRAIVFLGLLIVVAVNAAPAFRSAGGGLNGARSALNVLGDRLAAKVSAKTGYSLSGMHGKVVFGLLAALALRWIFFSGGGGGGMMPPPPSGYGTPSSSSNSPGGGEKYISAEYRAGWNDAQEERDFGSSMPAIYNDYAPPSAGGGGGPSGGGGPGIGSMITIGLLGKQIYEAGGPGPWNAQRAMANIKSLPTWRLAVMGLLVVRIMGLI